MAPFPSQSIVAPVPLYWAPIPLINLSSDRQCRGCEKGIDSRIQATCFVSCCSQVMHRKCYFDEEDKRKFHQLKCKVGNNMPPIASRDLAKDLKDNPKEAMKEIPPVVFSCPLESTASPQSNSLNQVVTPTAAPLIVRSYNEDEPKGSCCNSKILFMSVAIVITGIALKSLKNVLSEILQSK